MKFIIQRVHQGSVHVHEKETGSIKNGLLLLVVIKKGDTEKEAQWMVNKTINMRIFEDAEGKMNKSLLDVKGEVLLVPNFTLYADASSGNRPGFSEAETPQKAEKIYNRIVEMFDKAIGNTVQTGSFGANMDVELTNNGPVTIILEK